MNSILERFLPSSAGILMSTLSFIFLPNMQNQLLSRGQDIGNIFPPVFDLAMFFAGLLFAIYFIALSQSNGFIGKIIKTKTFYTFNQYVSKCIALCIILAIFSVVLMIIGVQKYNFIISVWAGVAVWVFGCVIRIFIVFLIMIKTNLRKQNHTKNGKVI